MVPLRLFFSNNKRSPKVSIRKIIVIGLLCSCIGSIYGINKLSGQCDVLRDQIASAELDLREAQAKKQKLEATLKRVRSSQSTPGVYAPHLKSIIRETLGFLGEKNVSAWTRLILLTVVTESDKGRYLRQVRGPARGITQCEPATEKEVLAWLKKHRPGTYERVRKLRVPARLRLHEAEYNVSYAVALCYGVYVMRRVNPKGDRLALARLYKKHYNTVAGKATVQGVLAKLESMGVEI